MSRNGVFALVAFLLLLATIGWSNTAHAQAANSFQSRAASGNESLGDFVRRRTDPQGRMTPFELEARVQACIRQVDLRRKNLSQAEKLRAFNRYHRLGGTQWPPGVTQEMAANHVINFGGVGGIVASILSSQYGLNPDGSPSANRESAPTPAGDPLVDYLDASTGFLSMRNGNTGETVTVRFRTEAGMDARALAELDHFFRDWRENEVVPIDRELYELLSGIQAASGSRSPMVLLSGYRSRATNEMLRRQNGDEVARNSYHVQARAADIHIPGVPVERLRDIAVDFEVGGVGYYPNNGFVHVDTGPVRRWNF